MSKRILYVTGHFPSLTETFIAREIAALRAQGLDIAVFPLRGCEWIRGGWAAVPSARRLARLVQELRGDRARPALMRAAGAALRAADIASRRWPCDHVHAHFLGLPAVTAYLVAGLIGKPYSVTAHARDIHAESTPEAVVRQARFRATCTEHNLRCLARKFPDAPFELVRHGLDPTAYARALPNGRGAACRILAVGRLVEKKGFTYLLQACRALQEQSFPWRCTIAGDGPLAGDLRREAERLRLTRRLTFSGAVSHGEVVRLLHRADVLVVPSVVARDGDQDGLPNIVLEAMAAGVPVAATDAGAMGEAVVHRRTGLMVAQRDPAAIAEAVEALWRDPELGETLVAAAGERLRTEFRHTSWAAKLRTLFLDGSAEPVS